MTGALRIVLFAGVLVAILSLAYGADKPASKSTEVKCGSDDNCRKNREPNELDLDKMRQIANGITNAKWTWQKSDIWNEHCASGRHNASDHSVPDRWFSERLVGEPYMWGGCDSAEDFACFHDQNCPKDFQQSACSSSYEPHRGIKKRSSGSHPWYTREKVNGIEIDVFHDTPEEDKACTTGVDCSGLLSQAWSLKTKVGTPRDNNPDNLYSLQYKSDPKFQVTVTRHKGETLGVIGGVEENSGGSWKPATDGRDFWSRLEPGDAIVEPGSHVVLVDYRVSKGEEMPGACVWEASGHRRYSEGGEPKYMDETAHHGFINDSWLREINEDSQTFRVFRFAGKITRRDPSTSPATPCDSPICYHNGLCFNHELTFRVGALGHQDTREVLITNESSRDLVFSATTPSGPNAKDFRIVSNSCGGALKNGTIQNAALAHDEKCTIKVEFYPKSEGPPERSAAIAFESGVRQNLVLLGYVQ